MKKLEKVKEARRMRERLYRENLADSYIRKLIRASMLKYGIDISSADIPQELIKAKRIAVGARRHCRELSK